MRILLINQTFYPDVAATAQHAHDLARSLVANGHEVTAIASRSIYGEKGAALPREEMVDGIRVVRVGQSIFGKSSITARLIDFALFYLLAFWRSMTMRRQEVVVCFTTPPFVALVGWFLRLIRGTRYVYWALDLYPDLPVACGVMSPRSPLTWILERVNRFCMRRADRVVVLGRCMESRVVAKGVPEERLLRINVWSDQDEIHPIARDENRFRREWGVGDRLLVMYSGNFGIGHDVETIADGVARLAGDPRIMFAFVGGGKRKPELLAMLKERGIGGFVDAPYQQRELLDELLGAADVHLASLRNGVEGIMVPSKLYGVLAAARPIVFIGAPDGEVAQLVREEGCGTVVACGDGAGLAESIRRYAADPGLVESEGARGRKALTERWSAALALRRWRELLEEVATPARRR